MSVTFNDQVRRPSHTMPRPQCNLEQALALLSSALARTHGRRLRLSMLCLVLFRFRKRVSRLVAFMQFLQHITRNSHDVWLSDAAD